MSYSNGSNYRDNLRWVPVRNVFGADIPPFSLVVVTGADADGTLQVTQATADSVLCLITHDAPIVKAGYGMGTFDTPAYVAYNAGATPANGQTWGAATGSFLLTTGKTGFTILGNAAGGLVEVVRPPAAASTVDASYTTDGTINLVVDQWLGAKRKWTDALAFPATDGNQQTPGWFYLCTDGHVQGSHTGHSSFNLRYVTNTSDSIVAFFDMTTGAPGSSSARCWAGGFGYSDAPGSTRFPGITANITYIKPGGQQGVIIVYGGIIVGFT